MSKLTDRISRLLELYESGHMQIEDFDGRYKELVDERERLRERINETDAQSAMRLAAEQAVRESAGQELSTETARRLVLAFIERIEAPVAAETPNDNGQPRKCRAAWVTLKLPMLDGTRRILAPFYTNAFKGERVLLDRE